MSRTCVTCDGELVNDAYHGGAQIYCSPRCRSMSRARRRAETMQQVALHRGTHHPTIINQRWREHAACIGLLHVEWFPETLPDAEPALAICERCPVTAHCYQEAERQYESGIWGATYFRFGVAHRLVRCATCFHLHTQARCPK
jgi:thiamine monophosphate synthase